VGLTEKSIEVPGGLGESAAYVVKLAGETKDQGRASLPVIEQGADPAGHDRAIGATGDLVGDPRGVGILQECHGE
jgi:hypothetical protein